MKYSKEKPTKPGWYWVKFDADCTVIVEVFQAGALAAVINDCFRYITEPFDVEWAGPIQEPEDDND